MTIIVSVATPEGIVMGADSRSTYTNFRGWPKIGTDSTHKLIQLSEDNAVSTAGRAIVNDRTISSHVGELVQRGAFPESPRGAAEVLSAYFQEQLAAEQAGAADTSAEGEPQEVEGGDDTEPVDDGATVPLILHVGGFEASRGVIYRVVLPGNAVHEMRSTEPDYSGAFWDGQIETLNRLHRGIDPRIDLSFLGQDDQARLETSLAGLQFIINFRFMTLQDAADYVLFLLRTTVGMQRFTDGVRAAPGEVTGTGGPLDVLAISRFGGLQWLRRKQLMLQNGTS